MFDEYDTLRAAAASHAEADAERRLTVRLAEVVLGVEICQGVAHLLQGERVGVARHVMIDVLVIPFGLVSGTGQHRYGFLGVLFLCGCELAAADDVIHEAEYALADDFLVNGHVRLEVGNLLLKSLNLGISSVISLFRGGYFSTGLIELVALLLANLDESVVLRLLVGLGLLSLLVCRLRSVTLTGRVLVLLVCSIVCRLGRCHGSVGGVGLLLRGGDGSLRSLQVRLCGGVCSRRGFERVLRGLELTGSSDLGGLKRAQVNTRTRDGSIERGLRLVELLLGVIARGGCDCREQRQSPASWPGQSSKLPRYSAFPAGRWPRQPWPGPDCPVQ